MGGYKGQYISPVMQEKISETVVEVGSHISLAVDDIDMMVDVKELYPALDVVVLTSLSEAQPLVLLEANCAGIPVVATDVGACKEMLVGRTAEDSKLGPSGVITSTANPAETAQAITGLLLNSDKYAEMSKTGRARVAAFYYRDNIFREYGDIYRSYRDRVLAGDFAQAEQAG